MTNDQSWNGGPRGYPYYRASYLTTIDNIYKWYEKNENWY